MHKERQIALEQILERNEDLQQASLKSCICSTTAYNRISENKYPLSNFQFGRTGLCRLYQITHKISKHKHRSWEDVLACE